MFWGKYRVFFEDGRQGTAERAEGLLSEPGPKDRPIGKPDRKDYPLVSLLQQSYIINHHSSI
ncbi:MAG TPA: hypothetical protein PKE06_28385, partial [Flavilitoribacter sp.]|nr:hypothetical protein [Flavilitoribacter sp.]HMQ88321.1 hypothetical protein [Flavilitoribacter sp.]